MDFKVHKYIHPDFSKKEFKLAPNCKLARVEKDGVAPNNYHALSIYPEYFKVNGKWLLAKESRMDTVCVVDDRPGKESLEILEFRKLKKGQKVALGRREDGSEGIFLWTGAFEDRDKASESFEFRSGRSRETAYSIDYDNLYENLKYEKENDGYVCLVIGSALALDRDSREGLANLINNSYVDVIFCGTETAALDLERGLYKTSWGQESFRREKNSYNNLYDTINLVRSYGSIKSLIDSGKVRDGFIKAAIESNVDIVIPGTIRDRFPLPETIDNVYRAQDEMRHHARKTSTMIMMGSILYTIASGNMTPSYNEFKGELRPVYMYTVDIQEFAVNKLSDRGSLTAKSIVTNTQDFIRNINRALNK